MVAVLSDAVELLRLWKDYSILCSNCLLKDFFHRKILSFPLLSRDFLSEIGGR